jgi:uncharacterized protein
MNMAFGDTCYFVALINSADSLHELACEFGELVDRIVTTEYVLVETANFFTKVELRQFFSEFAREIRASLTARIIPASTELFDRGLALFDSRPDKEWSLTDCISFVAMADLGITDALTADHHFEQAGFTALLT